MPIQYPDPDEAVEALSEPFRAKARLLTEKVGTSGLPLRLFEGVRTFARQQDLYAKGRKRDAKGVWRITEPSKVVTKAVPGQGAHNWGYAVDFVLDPESEWWGACRIAGPWDVGDAKNPLPKLAWEKYGRLVRECGLRWGGDWGWDMPHAELPGWREFRPKDWVRVVEKALAEQKP